MKSSIAMIWMMLCLSLPATVISFPAVGDTSLFEGHPDFELGGTSLVSGTNQQFSHSRALIRFDLSALPAGAVVTGVQMSLWVTRRPDPDQHGGPTDSDFSLYRMLVSWGEGTGSNATGSSALAGNATWNERHFGSASWGSPGALIGVDYANSASATKAVGDVGDYVWGSTSGLVDDVKAWQQNPAENFGFILISQSENSLGSGRRFGSKEQPGGSTPPALLIVTYTVVPEPAVAGLATAGMLAVSFMRRR